MKETILAPDKWKVWCPKENKQVPIWYCLGSYVKQRKTCPDLIEGTVYPSGRAKVKCNRNDNHPYYEVKKGLRIYVLRDRDTGKTDMKILPSDEKEIGIISVVDLVDKLRDLGASTLELRNALDFTRKQLSHAMWQWEGR